MMTSFQNSSVKFEFIYNEDNPDSLIMLEESAAVLRDMFSQTVNMFIWISQDHDLQIIKILSSDFGLQIQLGQSVQNVYQLITKCKENGMENFSCILIIDPAYKYEVQPITRMQEVAKVLLYEQQQDSCYELKIKSDKIQIVNDLFQLTQILRQFSEVSLKQRHLPSFISFKKECLTSSELLKSFFGILNYNLTSNIRKQIMQKIQLLIGYISKFNHSYFDGFFYFKQFISEIKEKKLEQQRALFWYTAESPIYKFINNLLRAAKFSTKVYYILPFFQDLYRAIQSLSRKEQVQQIVCYRGGTISSQEALTLKQSVGQYVQNLGFLSTSEDKNVALSFVDNILFEIYIINEFLTSGNILGFTRISNVSMFKEQKEVIFNPLRFFKVLQVSEHLITNNVVWRVRLELRIPYPLTSTNNLKEIIDYWMAISSKVTCQGIIYHQQYFPGYLEYWNKYNEIAASNEQNKKKIKAIYYLALYQLNCSNINSSLQRINKAIDFIRALKNQQSISENLDSSFNDCYINFLILKGTCLTQLNQFELAIKEFQKGLECCPHQQEMIWLRISIGRIYANQDYIYNYFRDYQEQTLCLVSNRDGFKLEFATCLKILGISYLKDPIKDAKVALRYFEQSGGIYLQYFGEHHWSYYQSLQYIAQAYMVLEKYQAALKLLFRVKHSAQNKFEKNLQYGRILSDIGVIFLNLGKYELAVQCFLKYQQIYSHFAGGGYQLTVIYCNIAYTYLKADYKHLTVLYLKKLLKILVQRYKTSQSDYKNVVNVLQYIANAYKQEYMFGKALKYFVIQHRLFYSHLLWSYLKRQPQSQFYQQNHVLKNKKQILKFQRSQVKVQLRRTNKAKNLIFCCRDFE